MKSAAVIIPTTGRKTLRRAVESVMNQSYDTVQCIVVCDGVEHPMPYNSSMQLVGSDLLKYTDPKYIKGFKQIRYTTIPFNTGANHYYGHRIYGALPFLLPHDYVFYLDDDNEFHPDHVATCIDLCESNGLDWCYAFREIYDGDTFVCRDECESLGKWPVWYNSKAGHIDTSCFCVKREVAVQIAPDWHRPMYVNGNPVTNADTMVANTLMRRFPRFDCTRRFTVKYRLGSREQTPKAEFFLKGNETYRQMCPDGLPWD